MKKTTLKEISGCEKISHPITRVAAFTLIELLVVIAIIAILAAMLMPVLNRAKQSGVKIDCMNNLKELAIAAQLYVDDNHGYYPPRSSADRWPDKFYDSYAHNTKLLLCPAEVTVPDSAGNNPSNNVADAAPRSYLINGWNDYFNGVLSESDLGDYLSGTYPQGLLQSIIRQPTGIILLGEKSTTAGDFYADLLNGDDIDQVVNESRHDANGQDTQNGMGSGGANYAMADASVHFIKFPGSLYPLNLWAMGTNQSSPQYVAYPN